MKKSNLVAGISLVFALMSLAAAAGTPGLNQREANQRARIHQGVKSGELTKPEARRLRVGEARLHLNEARAKSDGVVTRAEHKRLHSEANRESARIYRQKHDAQDRG